MREERRRLAAILAADVAGYSRLIAADESSTLARLKRLRAEVFEPQIAQFHGRIVGSAGDSLLIEFASAVNTAGGPQRYSGRPMGDSHRHLMLTAGEWEAFMDDVQQALDKFEVPQPEQAELKAIVESTRDAIVVAPLQEGPATSAEAH